MKKTPELFDEWNEQKKRIEFGYGNKKYCRSGEIRWYREGVNIGYEVSKPDSFLRPCIVLHNNLGNGCCLVVPLTTKGLDKNKEHFLFLEGCGLLGLKQSWIILNAIKTVDKRRLLKRIGNGLLSGSMIKKIKYYYRNLITKKSPY